MNALKWKEIMDGCCFGPVDLHTSFAESSRYLSHNFSFTEFKFELQIFYAIRQTVDMENTTCHLTLTPRVSELENI